MKILFYGINFAPELIGVGKYSSETVDYLVSQGHDVRVVTAPPYYPQWRVDPAYRAARYRRETIRGAQVWRVPLWVPRRPTGATRLIHLMSFAASGIPVLLMQWRWKPDVVFQVAPTLFCSFGALALGRATGARTWLHIQDFEVDAAFGLDVLKNGRLRRFVSAVEAFLLRRFDRVSTISNRMLEKAAGKGIDAERLIYFPNWVDTSTIGPGSCADLAERAAAYRRELNIGADALVALYSGNMGDKQGLEVITDAARALAQTPRLVFVLCGDGAAKAKLVTACAGLDNVRFIAMQPAERLGALLDMADIHLLPQRAGAADLVMPSKLGGMFASGKPVIAIADAGTELAKVVGPRGCIVPTGDPDAFATAIVALANDPERRAALGSLGRRYALDQLDKARVLSAVAHSLRVFAGAMEFAEQPAPPSDAPRAEAPPPSMLATDAQADLQRIAGK